MNYQKMPSGNCVLFIAGIGAFYSKLYNLKEHPNYSELYEPRENNSQNSIIIKRIAIW